MILEVCANSVQSAINAQAAGAQRVELCESLALGGTTPSYGSIALTRKNLTIKVNVLIRPRSGDFLYSEMEFRTIKEDIIMAKQLGVDGIVCGVLLSNGQVDIVQTRELVELARPLSFTFHRAFDRTPDPTAALEDVIATGADVILTSGQMAKAADATMLLTLLVQKANGRISIMPGSGVNADNISLLLNTGATEFHLSGQQPLESRMVYRKANVPLNSPPPNDYVNYETSTETIKKVLQSLNR